MFIYFIKKCIRAWTIAFVFIELSIAIYFIVHSTEISLNLLLLYPAAIAYFNITFLPLLISLSVIFALIIYLASEAHKGKNS